MRLHSFAKGWEQMWIWYEEALEVMNASAKDFCSPVSGYGGSCFPKDVQALAKSSAEVNYNFRILDAVMEVNEKQKLHLVPKVEQYFGNLKGKHFALWGLAFKPNTDDIREAPALYMIDALLEKGATVTAFDPEAMTKCKTSGGR
jgi:UDPglucose 6-dehydrogenase